jgi:hypothetical protein
VVNKVSFIIAGKGHVQNVNFIMAGVGRSQ